LAEIKRSDRLELRVSRTTDFLSSVVSEEKACRAQRYACVVARHDVYMRYRASNGVALRKASALSPVTFHFHFSSLTFHTVLAPLGRLITLRLGGFAICYLLLAIAWRNPLNHRNGVTA
jgi:hypothetical protein